MKKWIILLFLLFCFSYLWAQKQNNIWYFGWNAGVDFNINPPVALTDGALGTLEGCASVCDEHGQLLFYTDGVTVYNKQHQVIENGTGLLGHLSSAQSAVIVPWPDRDSIFYIFTSDARENAGSNGYNYSVVNMNKNNGLGSVISKNAFLQGPSTEKLTVTPHANGIDYWVLTIPMDDNSIYAYFSFCCRYSS